MNISIEQKVRFSTNSHWRGKPNKTDDLDKYGNNIFKYNDKRIHIGYNWINLEGSYKDLFDLIAIEGYSVAPQLTDESHGNLKGVYFKSHSLVMVDIDKGMNIEDLLTDKLYMNFGSGYYTSPSHTDEQHRFRIIFRLETDITKADEMVIVYNWFIKHFGGDKQCKNSTRLFYGTLNAPRKEITDRCLSARFVSKIIAEEKTRLALEEARKNILFKSTFKNTLTIDLQSIKKDLMSGKHYLGDHSNYGKLAASMAASGFTLNDFIEVTPYVANSKTSDDARRFWNDWTKYKSISAGTLLHLLKVC